MSRPVILLFASILWSGVVADSVRAQDVIEFLSGATSQGKVVRILKAERNVVFETKLGSKTVQRTYPYAKIHCVTYKGKKYVLTKKTTDGGKPTKRTPQEIETLIEQVGSTPPDWLNDTPLDFPDTLDLNLA